MTQQSHQPIVLSVQQITSLIKQQIEGPFQRVWIQGEVANLKKAASGHLYFSLIDPNNLLNAVLFRAEAAHLPILPQNGDSIIAEGQIVLFAARGSYQLIVRSIQLSGLGSLLLAKQLLKKKLAALGWFAEARKKQLPKSVKTFGVITSPTGAVIRDIVNVLKRRVGSFHLILNPVPVQGEEAPRQIAKAIRDMNQYAIGDILIVCRGGGSQEDLAAFDSEEVAKAAFESNIPIISAVGHETDFTILDLVADVRAPTPSAAAEIASQETKDLLEKISFIKQTLVRGFKTRILATKTHFKTLSNQLNAHHPKKNIAALRIDLSQMEETVLQTCINQVQAKKRALLLAKNLCRSLAPKEKLQQKKRDLFFRLQTLKTYEKRYFFEAQTSLKKAKKLLLEKFSWHVQAKRKLLETTCSEDQMSKILLSKCATYRSNLKKLASHVFSINPLLPLSKGFALVKNPNEKVCSSVHDLIIDEKVSLIFSDGSAQAIIKEKQVNSP